MIWSTFIGSLVLLVLWDYRSLLLARVAITFRLFLSSSSASSACSSQRSNCDQGVLRWGWTQYDRKLESRSRIFGISSFTPWNWTLQPSAAWARGNPSSTIDEDKKDRIALLRGISLRDSTISWHWGLRTAKQSSRWSNIGEYPIHNVSTRISLLQTRYIYHGYVFHILLTFEKQHI